MKQQVVTDFNGILIKGFWYCTISASCVLQINSIDIVSGCPHLSQRDDHLHTSISGAVISEQTDDQ